MFWSQMVDVLSGVDVDPGNYELWHDHALFKRTGLELGAGRDDTSHLNVAP
jgi:hypothetical protein